jgi:small ligand-binding sensory domain FIST
VFRDQQKSQILEKLQQKIGPTVPWIGLYTYGEIGPIGGHDCFHNYTAVVLAVY